MKRIGLFFALFCGMMVGAQEATEMTIGGQSFSLEESVWLYQQGDSLQVSQVKPSGVNAKEWVQVWMHGSFQTAPTVESGYVAVHKGPTWNQWYQQGSPTLRSILDLGPNVLFRFRDNNGEEHTYTVVQTEKILVLSSESSKTLFGLQPVTLGAIGGGVVAGVLILENNDGDNDESPSLPKK